MTEFRLQFLAGLPSPGTSFDTTSLLFQGECLVKYVMLTKKLWSDWNCPGSLYGCYLFSEDKFFWLTEFFSSMSDFRQFRR